ncbi:MAG: carboxypeptidase regulatory-like domain-containing protein [Anaerolineales bacterium]|nr:carboxypeptidase regulatory-like domain-containing protein [Anaerolineales bacterium]
MNISNKSKPSKKVVWVSLMRKFMEGIVLTGMLFSTLGMTGVPLPVNPVIQTQYEGTCLVDSARQGSVRIPNFLNIPEPHYFIDLHIPSPAPMFVRKEDGTIHVFTNQSWLPQSDVDDWVVQEPGTDTWNGNIVPANTYRVLVEKRWLLDPLDSRFSDLYISEHPDNLLQLHCWLGGGIGGLVKYSSGQLVSGANVTLSNGAFTSTTTTDTSGAYGFDSVPAGSVTISATINGISGQVSANLTAGQSQQASIIWLNVGNPPPPAQNGIELVSVSNHNVQPGEKFNPSVTIRVTSGYLDPARGDHLHATPEDQSNTLGAWPVQAVKSYVGTGQTYTFNVSNDAGFQMTAPNSPGNYQVVWQLRVGGNHIGPQAIIHISVGMPNRAPSSPTPLAPNDWAEIHSQQAPELCWSAVGDPDGDSVQYYAEIYQSAVLDNSGWINGTCWRPTTIYGQYFGYQWHVKARDSRGAESGFGNTIHFTLSPPLYDPQQPTSVPQSIPALPIQTGYSWDSTYLYRRPLVITTNDDLKAGMLIKVDGIDLETLVAEGKIRADHNDLRVVRRLSANTWQEVQRIYASSWDVEFQLLSDIYPGTDTSYYLYYGNPSAGVPPTFSLPNGWYVDMYRDKWWESWGGTWEYNQAIDFNNSCESPLNHNTKLNSSFDDSDKYRGRIYIPSTGNWTFNVYTNDGYRLYIDGVEVGRFDGYTGERWATIGSLDLKAGWHWMDARNMWVNCGPWKLAMSGPGFGNQIIPANYFQKSWGNVKTGISPSAEELNLPVTNTPTPTLTPTIMSTSTPVATGTVNQSSTDSSLYSFEGGTTQGWSSVESITSVTNTTNNAFLGTHSLCATSNFPGGGWDDGYAFVDKDVTVGDTITARLYVPAGYTDISSSIYLLDANWGWYESSFTGLTPGTWTTLTWDLSGLGFVTPTHRFGFHIGSSSSYQGCVYIDSVNVTSGVNSPTPTNTLISTPTPIAISTPVATGTVNQPSVDSSLYSFEGGTTQGWSSVESITSVTNTTSNAFLGTHSLCATSNFPGGGWDDGYAFVDKEVTAGDTITARLYVPAGYNDISSSIYLLDANWGWYESSFTGLTPGTWTTLTWDLSGLGFVTPTHRFGFHIGSSSPYQGCVYIDSVNIVSQVNSTQTPTLASTNTLTPVPTFTQTETNTPLPTATLVPSSTPTLVPTSTFTPVPTFTPTKTNTPLPTATVGSTLTPTKTKTPTPVASPTKTRTPTPSSSPTKTATPTSTTASSGTELLTQPWHLVGNNGAAELYQSISSNALQGKVRVCATYDLHGLNALGGDASAIIFDQSGWKYVSLSNYGQNGLNGVQTACIPLSNFPGLNSNASVGTLHTRFWYSGPFTVDITSVKVYSTP